MGDSGSSRPRGPITTLLDLTDRDAQENDLFPLQTNTTWFSRDDKRRTITFTPQVQTIPFRGPAAFGQRFTFDLGSVQVGDVLFGAALQLRLGHWLDATALGRLATGSMSYTDPSGAWEYANSLGTACIAAAELEIDGVTVETIDGDFCNVFSVLFSDYNTSVGVSYDHLGRLPLQTLRNIGLPQGLRPRNFPTEDGTLHCILPFFFGRVRYQEALPMISIKEGLVKLHITLRPFDEVVRQVRGWRDTCDAVPLGTTVSLTAAGGGSPTTVQTAVAIPPLESVALITHGALFDGELRQKLLKDPYEMMHRAVQTFSFTQPLKYLVNRADTMTVQLPLEANHPVEEILWFVRRKGVAMNNEWTNYGDKLEREWPRPAPNPAFLVKPLLVRAALQINGSTVVDADEQYFRSQIAAKHRGGFAAFSNFIYGISFAQRPGEFQPSGSANLSRANSVRLTLEVRPPGGAFDAEWEVKVFCIGLNWMRYENGIANAVFSS